MFNMVPSLSFSTYIYRANWTEETIREIWDAVKKNNDEYRHKPFDENNENMKEMIKQFEVPNEHFCPPPPP